MFITVGDAIKLPSFSTAKVIAGEKGLSRRIYRVSVAECPEFPLDVDIVGKDNLLFIDGDFFITSFYSLKDTPELLLQTIKLYNQFNSSGICIVLRYYKEIPESVIDYANRYDFPIITVDRATAYAEMISDITKAIYAPYNQQLACDILDQILSGNQSNEKMKKLAYALDLKLKNNIIIFCIKYDDADNNMINNMINRLNVNQYLHCVNYYDKIIAIVSSGRTFKRSEIENAKLSIIEVLDSFKISYRIGVSNIYREIHYLKDAIQNAIIACDICEFMDKTVLSYDNAGVYKLLMKIPDKSFLKEYYNSIIMPVCQYDRLNKGHLFNTMMCYAKNGGDIKKTADDLYQHENTIRYRINKIKAILDREDNNLQFCEDICLAYKLHTLLKDNEN